MIEWRLPADDSGFEDLVLQRFSVLNEETGGEEKRDAYEPGTT